MVLKWLFVVLMPNTKPFALKFAVLILNANIVCAHYQYQCLNFTGHYPETIFCNRVWGTTYVGLAGIQT